jgi:hypothetical protein
VLIDRIGDPFVPAMLDGVCIHVHVVSEPGSVGRHVRVVIESLEGRPFAYGHDEAIIEAALMAVTDDVRARPDAYREAFTRLEAARRQARERDGS